MKELVQKVKQWGIDRGLDKVGHLAQAKYTLKETAELLDAYADSDIDAINDAIGDILVTLIVGASNDKYTYELFTRDLYSCDDEVFKVETSTERSIDDLLLKVTSLLFKKERIGMDYYLCAHALNRVLFVINRDLNQKLSLQDCLQLAYNEIKDRMGKKVNGQFIKD